MSFVGLHIHSDYSLLDGASQLPQLVDRALELEMPAIALTDHGVMYGAIELIKVCRGKGIKPIIGNEMYVINGDIEKQERRPRYHQVVLAKNNQGYKNLVKLTSISGLKGVQGKGIFSRPCINKDLLEKYREGLIVTSACLGGEVPQAILKGRADAARKVAKWYKDIFGDDYYLEIQDHGSQEDRIVNVEIVKIARELEIKIIATNDSHFISCYDVEAHDALLCIQTAKLITDEKRLRYSGTEYLKSAEEMKQLFRDHLPDEVIEEAIANTLEVASKVEQYDIMGASRIPNYPNIPNGHNANTWVQEKAWEGLQERFNTKKADINPIYKERLEYELKMIEQMGFSTYFLVVWDYIKFARDNGIPVGPGRGSAAGSLVAYALKITNIDPVHHGLLFERFLNPERKSMPDIDTDFCIDRREEVIEYVTKKYGTERVAQIITFNRLTSKAVLKDVARVLGIPYNEADKMAKLIPVSRGKPEKLKVMISDETPAPEFKVAYETAVYETTSEPKTQVTARQWLDMAIRIEGTNKTFGVHAAGVVISSDPLDEIVPLQKNNEGAVITQYFMEDLESLGLLKMDFLGLRNLTMLQKTVELIKKTQNCAIDPEQLPLEDRKAQETFARLKKLPKDVEKTYKILEKGDLEGIFQLESSGMRQVVQKLKPSNIEDISSILALYRPGPLDAGLIDTFIDRKHGREGIRYQHQLLETILNETYGVIVYQEQIMKVAQDLAGYSLGQADLLRRCLSGDTEIVDAATGCLVPLREIAAKPEYWLGRKVFSLELETQKIIQQPITEIHANGIRDVWEITTKTNRKIKATDDHLFYALLGWKPLKTFKIGDRIGLAKTLPIADASEGEHPIFVNRRSGRSIPADNLSVRSRNLLPECFAPTKMGYSLSEVSDAQIKLVAYPMYSGLNFREYLTFEEPNPPAPFPFREGGEFFPSSLLGKGGRGEFFPPPRFGEGGRGERFFPACKSEMLSNFQKTPTRSLARHRVGNFAIAFQNQELQAIADSEVFWDEIVSINYVGKEEVFDLTIPDTHNFIANDAIAHNCMGKKKADEMQKQRETFIDGATKKGIKARIAEDLFDQMVKFAEYCFNKSHSTAYAYVTYQTAYLKANYTVEYMTALLTTNSGDQDKVKKYLAYCLSMGIVVEPPDINRSEVEFTPIEKKILFGLSAVKNVGETAIACILEARAKEGAFKSLSDLCDRVDQRAVNSRTLESLIKCGAFDKLDPNRQQLVKDLEFVTKWAHDRAKDREIGQGNLFDLLGFAEPGKNGNKAFESIPKASLVADFTSKEKLQFEKDLLGCYVSEHPLKFAKQAAAHLGIETISLGELEEQRNNTKVKAIAIIAEVKHKTTKKGESMAILPIEDLEGQTEAIVFPKTYAEIKSSLIADVPVIISGKIDKQDERTQLVVEKIEPIDPELLTLAKPQPQPSLEDAEESESESVAIASSLPPYSIPEERRKPEPPPMASSSSLPPYSMPEERRKPEPPPMASSSSLPPYSISEERRKPEPPPMASSSSLPPYSISEERRKPEPPAIASSLPQPVSDRQIQSLPAMMMMVMLTDVKRAIAKNGDRLLHLQIQDIAGVAEAIVLPQNYERILNVLDINIPAIVWGKQEQCDERMQLIIDNIIPLEAPHRVMVELTLQQIKDRSRLDILKRLLQEYSGEKEKTKVPVVAIVQTNRLRKLICLENAIWVQNCQDVANRLKSAGFTAYVQSLTRG